MGKADILDNSLVRTGIALAAFTLPSVGCTVDPYADLSPAQARVARLNDVQNYGQGVYEFKADSSFPQTLADFRKEHHDERIVSVTQGRDVVDGAGGSTYAHSESFIVVTEAMDAEKQ